MASITFDKQRIATIIIDNVGNDISFLMCPMFDNSELNLLRDIELCDNQEEKRVLVSFYEHITKSNKIFNKEVAYTTKDDISLEFEPGSGGDWCAVVHNIKPEHSGFWYAAQDLETEKCSLIKLRHELKGIKIAVENIDNVIKTIRSVVSTDEAVPKLLELGLDRQQAKAFMRIKLNNLAAYDPSNISDKIAECDEWIKFIENLS